MRTILISIFDYEYEYEYEYMFSLPMARPGHVFGLVGMNGIGKTTALKVLSGKLKPNLGKFAVDRTVIRYNLCLALIAPCPLPSVLCLSTPRSTPLGDAEPT